MKIHLLKAVIILGCTLIVSLIIYNHMALEGRVEDQTTKLLKKARAMNAFNKVDQFHRSNINKALEVINRYNPEMPEDQKYRIASEISIASIKYDNLDVDLICATITHESAFTWDPKVVSPAGALGLMQVMPATGRFLAGIEGLSWTNPREVLFDPIQNIRLGCRYLSSLIELYDVDGGLAAYNGGGSRVRKWLARNRAKGILYKETQKYVPAVLSLYDQFRE
ncbi:lytic transglycosylase domain-containing protein [bacterium]|nr:lytic transglycosylase domain-containing protein [bacterium]